MHSIYSPPAPPIHFLFFLLTIITLASTLALPSPQNELSIAPLNFDDKAYCSRPKPDAAQVAAAGNGGLGVCVSPHPSYMTWASESGTPLSCNDCQNAWYRLWQRIRPFHNQQREFTYWYQKDPGERLEYKTPLYEVEGSCVVSINMIRSLPFRNAHDERILPEPELTHNYDSLPLVDTAIAADIRDAVHRIAECLYELGSHGTWAVGKNKAIGVFFWSSDSEIARTYSTSIAQEVQHEEEPEKEDNGRVVLPSGIS